MFELHAAPPSPGEILQEEFLTPLGMTQVQLAERIGVPVQRVNTLIHGKRGVTPETAILLAEAFGTSAEFWMNLQQSTDLWAARQRISSAKKPSSGREKKKVTAAELRTGYRAYSVAGRSLGKGTVSAEKSRSGARRTSSSQGRRKSG